MIYKVSTTKKERSISYVVGESADGRRLETEEYTSVEYNILVEGCYGVRNLFVNRYTTVVIPEGTETAFHSTKREDYEAFSPFDEWYVNLDTCEVSKDYGQLVSPSQWREKDYNPKLAAMVKEKI